MASAYRKHYGANEDMRLEIDFDKRTVRMFARRPIEQPISATNLPTLADGLEVPQTDYSPEMRSIKWAYLAQRTPAPGTFYLFIVPSFTGNPGMVGYMPLKSSYGFLVPTATARDAAHELGHGVFNLRHTFSPDNIFKLDESTTDNLMDYKGGDELWKYQWDFAHDPESGLFVFEDSDESAARITGIHFNFKLLSDNQVLNFIPEKAQSIELVAGITKQGVLNPEKIRWTHKIEEPEKVDRITLLVNQNFFEEADSIAVHGKQWRLLSADIEKMVVLKKLDFSITSTIEVYCDSIIELGNRFDSLKTSLVVPDYMDKILFKNTSNAYSRHMSAITSREGEPADSFNQALFEMHLLDEVMESDSNFDNLYHLVKAKRSNSEEWQNFLQQVINALPEVDPLKNSETLIKEYKEQTITKVRELMLGSNN